MRPTWRPMAGRWLLAGMLLLMAPVSVLAMGGAIQEAVNGQDSRALRWGDRGEAVRELQALLQESGFDPGKLDGIFGPLTDAAVRMAQRGLALEVDGLAGPATLQALQEYLMAANEVVPEAEEVQLIVHRMPVQAEHEGRTAVAVTATAVQAIGEANPVTVQPFGLTFNGLPPEESVPALLESLQRYGMQATFFVSGDMVKAHSRTIKHLFDAGHEIGSQGWTDLDMTEVSERLMAAQLISSRQAIFDVTGKMPSFFRPPGGAYNHVLLQTSERMGLRMALWTNVLVRERPGDAPAVMATGLLESVYPGAVIMVRSDYPGIGEAMAIFLREAVARGLSSITLSELDSQ